MQLISMITSVILSLGVLQLAHARQCGGADEGGYELASIISLPNSRNDGLDIVWSAVSADSNKMVIARATEQSRLYDIENPHSSRELMRFQNGRKFLARFSPNSDSLVVTGSGQGTWLVNINPVIRTKISDEDAFDFAFSPDGKKVAVLGSSGIENWDIDSGISFQTLKIDASENINHIFFTSDGKRIVTNNKINGDIKIWDIKQEKKLLTMPITEVETGSEELAASAAYAVPLDNSAIAQYYAFKGPMDDDAWKYFTRLLDIDTGKEIASMPGMILARWEGLKSIGNLVFYESFDDKYVYSVDIQSNEIQPYMPISIDENEEYEVNLLAQSNILALGDESTDTIYLYDTATKALIGKLNTKLRDRFGDHYDIYSDEKGKLIVIEKASDVELWAKCEPN